MRRSGLSPLEATARIAKWGGGFNAGGPPPSPENPGKITVLAGQMMRLRSQEVTISVTITITKITSSTSPAWSQ